VNVLVSILVAALGACIGSFLNVVIYRLPRGLSVLRPRRSFCPHCQTPIAAYDNIPLLSVIVLGGRCRHCRAPISPQYPLIEWVAALLLLATFDVFIVGGWRAGVGVWPRDASILIAHWALWAGLLAVSVMDIEAYYLDIRVTTVVAIIGLVGQTLWTPATSAAWIRPSPALAVASIVAAIALAITALVRGALSPLSESDEPDSVAPEGGQESDDGASDEAPAIVDKPHDPRVSVVLALLGIGLLIGYLGWMWWPSVVGGWDAASIGAHSSFEQTAARFGALVVLLMGLIVVASSLPRSSDQEILDAIEEESGSARSVALRELVFLLPAVIAGIGVYVWAVSSPAGPDRFASFVYWSPIGQWRPVLGLTTGLCGFLLAGTLGWGVRILFTIALGKEALDVGDIHILAAAGAVTGWLVVVLGFFLAAPLALVGVLVFALRRATGAIQYGPWLALGLFIAAALQDIILRALGFASWVR
jgi:prepilin signal peptidase PulO-like enzyme (type II secretory pathway)